MNSYENPTVGTYRFPAAAIASAGVFGRIIGPAGMKGRLVALGSVVTTGVTVAAALVSVGNSGDADAYGTQSIPVSAAGAALNTLTRGVDNTIDADSTVELSSDGGATAGAADIIAIINWY